MLSGQGRHGVTVWVEEGQCTGLWEVATESCHGESPLHTWGKFSKWPFQQIKHTNYIPVALYTSSVLVY